MLNLSSRSRLPMPRPAVPLHVTDKFLADVRLQCRSPAWGSKLGSHACGALPGQQPGCAQKGSPLLPIARH